VALNLTRRRAVSAIALVAVVAILAYLRDPPWLSDVSSGFYGWQTHDDGVRFRWMSGHASFFVPADAAFIEIPLRAEFESPHDWNVAASVAIDDRPAARIELTDETWHSLRVLLPPPPAGGCAALTSASTGSTATTAACRWAKSESPWGPDASLASI
jgi:hypothetical protein